MNIRLKICDKVIVEKACDKVVNDYPSAVQLVPNQYKTQEMCDKVVSKEPSMLKYYPDNHKIQTMCDETVDFYLITLNCYRYEYEYQMIPDDLNNILERLDNSVFSNCDIFLHNVCSNIITFPCDDMGSNNIDGKNINLNDDNFDEDDPETMNHVRLIIWRNRQ